MYSTDPDLLTPMEGKTDEEKEQIAEEALARMKALPPEELAKLQEPMKQSDWNILFPDFMRVFGLLIPDSPIRKIDKVRRRKR